MEKVEKIIIEENKDVLLENLEIGYLAIWNLQDVDVVIRNCKIECFAFSDCNVNKLDIEDSIFNFWVRNIFVKEQTIITNNRIQLLNLKTKDFITSRNKNIFFRVIDNIKIRLMMKNR